MPPLLGSWLSLLEVFSLPLHPRAAWHWPHPRASPGLRTAGLAAHTSDGRQALCWCAGLGGTSVWRWQPYEKRAQEGVQGQRGKEGRWEVQEGGLGAVNVGSQGGLPSALTWAWALGSSRSRHPTCRAFVWMIPAPTKFSGLGSTLSKRAEPNPRS